MSPAAVVGRALLVVLDGVAPGVGKSTLAAGVADWCAGLGVRVDHFREAEILSRPAFSGVARQFRDRDRVAPDALLDAIESYLAALDADGMDVAILDALLPFIPSLLAWAYDDAAVGAFVTDLTELLRGRPLLVLYLDGDPEQAIARAVGREDPGWLAWLVSRYVGVRCGGPVRDAASLVEHFRRRRRLTLRLLIERGWDLVVLDADAVSAAGLLAAATAALRRRGVGA